MEQTETARRSRPRPLRWRLIGVIGLVIVLCAAAILYANLHQPFSLTYIATHRASPDNIKAEPDGNLWFTETGALGRITPNGTLKEFPLADLPPVADFTGGRDGTLLFSQYAGDIVRFDPKSGVFTMSPVPDTSQSAGIFSSGVFYSPLAAVGEAHGDIWILECGDTGASNCSSYWLDNIGSNTSETRYQVKLSNPTSIARSSDGNLWMTDAGANEVVRAGF
jgi:streptogramin lyase